MKQMLNKNTILVSYLTSSVIGSVLLYCFLSEVKLDLKGFILSIMTPIASFIIGYVVLKLVTIIHKIEKESYEYRKNHPIEEEPW